jgi:ubiquinone/menaquinone biosynthesis C-methylase UbiE
VVTQEAQEYWNAQAETFDDEPDHGLADVSVRAAWRDLLLDHLPEPPADIVDLGCGTGSLAVLLATENYRVQGLDLADNMVSAARTKAHAAGVEVSFEQGDAASPPYSPASCDVVLARHLTWALPDPSAAVRRWGGLLRPGGRMVLIEGRWSTGAGLAASECEALVLQHRKTAYVRHLTEPVLWGGPTDDERYLLVSRW